MDESFMVFVRVRYAASIKNFDGNFRKSLHLEIELWNVAQQETVWRLELRGLDQRSTLSDMQFVKNALWEGFGKIPHYLPANNESNW
jgi:hypothetical protein